MKISKITIIISVFISYGELLCAQDSSQFFKIGSAQVSIPNPVGFIRYDGINSKVDALTEQCTPPMNLHIASYCSDVDLSEVTKGYSPDGLEFRIEASRIGETRDVTPLAFQNALAYTSKKMENQTQFSNIINASDKLLSNKFKATVKSDSPVYISSFGKSTNAYGYTIIMNQSVVTPNGETKESDLMLQSVMMLYFKNKVFYLSTIQPYQDKIQINESQNKLINWADRILLVNH
jgi:hypothetical protein